MAPSAWQLGLTGNLDGLAKETADRLARRVSATELADPYLGPILFSPRAAAEFVRQTLAGDVAGTPPPVVADDEVVERLRPDPVRPSRRHRRRPAPAGIRPGDSRRRGE